MDELVQRLSTGDHPVTVGGPQPSPEELKRRVEEIGIRCIADIDLATLNGTGHLVVVEKSELVAAE